MLAKARKGVHDQCMHANVSNLQTYLIASASCAGGAASAGNAIGANFLHTIIRIIQGR